MIRVNKNDFNYKKKLMAFKPDSFTMLNSGTGSNLFEMFIDCISISEDKDNNNLKYISVGTATRYFFDEDDDMDPLSASYDKFINNASDLRVRFDRRYDQTLKVHENGTFWTSDSIPIDTLYPLVKSFEKILKDFIATGCLPTDYDYWFINGRE